MKKRKEQTQENKPTWETRRDTKATTIKKEEKRSTTKDKRNNYVSVSAKQHSTPSMTNWMFIRQRQRVQC